MKTPSMNVGFGGLANARPASPAALRNPMGDSRPGPVRAEPLAGRGRSSSLAPVEAPQNNKPMPGSDLDADVIPRRPSRSPARVQPGTEFDPIAGKLPNGFERNRSSSRGPLASLERNQNMTSIGPGLDGSLRRSNLSPARGMENPNSLASVGPGLGAMAPSPARHRSSSRGHLDSMEGDQSLTSIGPGLDGIPRRPSRSPVRSQGPLDSLNYSLTSTGPGLGNSIPGPQRKRSSSRGPLDTLESNQSMTSIGPGLSGIGRAPSRSPAPPGGAEARDDMTSVGPGLDGLSQARERKRSFSRDSRAALDTLEHNQAMTSIGPGLDGMPRRSSRSPAPLEGRASHAAAPPAREPSERRRGESPAHAKQGALGSLEAGPSALNSVRQQAVADLPDAPSAPSTEISAVKRPPSPARFRSGSPAGGALEAGPGGLSSLRREIHAAASEPLPPSQKRGSEFSRVDICSPPAPLSRGPPEPDSPLAGRRGASDVESLASFASDMVINGKEKKKKEKKHKKDKKLCNEAATFNLQHLEEPAGGPGDARGMRDIELLRGQEPLGDMASSTSKKSRKNKETKANEHMNAGFAHRFSRESRQSSKDSFESIVSSAAFSNADLDGGASMMMFDRGKSKRGKKDKKVKKEKKQKQEEQRHTYQSKEQKGIIQEDAIDSAALSSQRFKGSSDKRFQDEDDTVGSKGETLRHVKEISIDGRAQGGDENDQNSWDSFEDSEAFEQSIANAIGVGKSSQPVKDQDVASNGEKLRHEKDTPVDGKGGAHNERDIDRNEWESDFEDSEAFDDKSSRRRSSVKDYLNDVMSDVAPSQQKQERKEMQSETTEATLSGTLLSTTAPRSTPSHASEQNRTELENYGQSRDFERSSSCEDEANVHEEDRAAAARNQLEACLDNLISAGAEASAYLADKASPEPNVSSDVQHSSDNGIAASQHGLAQSYVSDAFRGHMSSGRQSLKETERNGIDDRVDADDTVGRKVGEVHNVSSVRFLIGFNPLMLAAERQGTISYASALDVSSLAMARKSDTQGFRQLAERILTKDLKLPLEHSAQVEALLRQLGARGLPVYRVIRPDGAEVIEAPHSGTHSLQFRLPQSALVLARERRRLRDGWWIRLAAGGGWIREAESAERCEPSMDEVRRWMDQAKNTHATAASAFILKNAVAVWYQASRTILRLNAGAENMGIFVLSTLDWQEGDILRIGSSAQSELIEIRQTPETDYINVRSPLQFAHAAGTEVHKVQRKTKTQTK